MKKLHIVVLYEVFYCDVNTCEDTGAIDAVI